MNGNQNQNQGAVWFLRIIMTGIILIPAFCLAKFIFSPATFGGPGLNFWWLAAFGGGMALALLGWHVLGFSEVQNRRIGLTGWIFVAAIVFVLLGGVYRAIDDTVTEWSESVGIAALVNTVGDTVDTLLGHAEATETEVGAEPAEVAVETAEVETEAAETDTNSAPSAAWLTKVDQDAIANAEGDLAGEEIPAEDNQGDQDLGVAPEAEEEAPAAFEMFSLQAAQAALTATQSITETLEDGTVVYTYLPGGDNIGEIAFDVGHPDGYEEGTCLRFWQAANLENLAWVSIFCNWELSEGVRVQMGHPTELQFAGTGRVVFELHRDHVASATVEPDPYWVAAGTKGEVTGLGWFFDGFAPESGNVSVCVNGECVDSAELGDGIGNYQIDFPYDLDGYYQIEITLDDGVVTMWQGERVTVTSNFDEPLPIEAADTADTDA